MSSGHLLMKNLSIKRTVFLTQAGTSSQELWNLSWDGKLALYANVRSRIEQNQQITLTLSVRHQHMLLHMLPLLGSKYNVKCQQQSSGFRGGGKVILKSSGTGSILLLAKRWQIPTKKRGINRIMWNTLNSLYTHMTKLRK